jgi:hypothetical protein
VGEVPHPPPVVCGTATFGVVAPGVGLCARRTRCGVMPYRWFRWLRSDQPTSASGATTRPVPTSVKKARSPNASLVRRDIVCGGWVTRGLVRRGIATVLPARLRGELSGSGGKAARPVTIGVRLHPKGPGGTRIVVPPLLPAACGVGVRGEWGRTRRGPSRDGYAIAYRSVFVDHQGPLCEFTICESLERVCNGRLLCLIHY